MAQNVTKPVFSTLMCKLWECSFKSCHFDKAAILDKLAASIPFTLSGSSSTVPSSASSDISSASSSGVSASSGPSSSSGAVAFQGTLLIKGACTNCGAALTPIRPHLTLHFQNLLQQKHAAKGTTKRKRVKPRFYGEALTSDEVFEWLQADEESKRSRQKKRKKAPPTQCENRVCSSAVVDESGTESHNEGKVYYHYIFYGGEMYYSPSINIFPSLFHRRGVYMSDLQKGRK